MDRRLPLEDRMEGKRKFRDKVDFQEGLSSYMAGSSDTFVLFASISVLLVLSTIILSRFKLNS